MAVRCGGKADGGRAGCKGFFVPTRVCKALDPRGGEGSEVGEEGAAGHGAGWVCSVCGAERDVDGVMRVQEEAEKDAAAALGVYEVEGGLEGKRVALEAVLKKHEGVLGEWYIHRPPATLSHDLLKEPPPSFHLL